MINYLALLISLVLLWMLTEVVPEKFRSSIYLIAFIVLISNFWIQFIELILRSVFPGMV